MIDNDVEIFDDELSALNDFGGATLTVRAATPSTGHQFEPGGPLTFNGSDFLLNGDPKGTFITGTESIVFTFADGVTNDEVNQIMQSLRYNNSSDTPPSSVSLDWVFSDGNDNGSQGDGGALANVLGGTTVNIIAVNNEPTVDLDSVSYTHLTLPTNREV